MRIYEPEKGQKISLFPNCKTYNCHFFPTTCDRSEAVNNYYNS